MPPDLLELAKKLPFSQANGHISDGGPPTPGPFAAKLLSSVTWSTQATSLKEFFDKHPLPNIVKVTKGQYRNVGASKSVHNVLYLHTVTTSKKVVVESVKIKEGKKAVVIDNRKYAVPLSYQGWFEVLSEDGKAVRPIGTIQELAVASVKNPALKFLVREGIQAFYHSPNGDLDQTNVHIIPAGDIVETFGEVNLKFTNSITRKRFLRVSVTTTEEKLYLPFNMKGSFNPIAGQHNISGVHSALSLLEKFRLPIMVKLVHGLIPTKLQKHFTGAFRLLHVFTDETAFVCPFKKEGRMIPISTREPLKLVCSQNINDLEQDQDFKFLEDRCAEMHASFMNSIHVLFSMPDPADLSQNRKKLVTPKDNIPSVIPPDEEDVLFKEVEDIYHYVREGGVEPPPRPRPPVSNNSKPAIQIVKIGSSDAPSPNPTPSPKPQTGSKSPFKVISKAFKRGKFKSLTDKTEYETSSQNLKPDAGALSPFEPPPDDAFFNFDDEPPLSPLSPNTPNIDYWEEPIYAPLHKFRKDNVNKNDKETVIKLGKGGKKPELAADPEENYRNEVLPPNVNRDAQIQNLRQIYKSKSVPSKSDGSSGGNLTGPSTPATRSKHYSGDTVAAQFDDDLEDYLQDIKPPPPVPPKNLDADELRQLLQNSPVKSRALRSSLSEKMLNVGKDEGDEFRQTPSTTSEYNWAETEAGRYSGQKAYYIKRISKTDRPMSSSHGENLHLVGGSTPYTLKSFAPVDSGSSGSTRESRKTVSSKPVAIMYAADGRPIELLQQPSTSLPDSHNNPYIAVAKVDGQKQRGHLYENLGANSRGYFQKATDKEHKKRRRLKSMYL